MIRAVFFDIGGTVHTQDATPDTDRDYAERLWHFLSGRGIRTTEDPMELLACVDRGAKAYKAFAESELTELPSDRIWQEFMLKEFSFSPGQMDGLGEELSYLYDRFRKKITKREGLAETLAGLKERGYTLGVISNIMSRSFVPGILEEHGVAQYFRTLTLSSVCGIRKPRPEIFEAALEASGVAREEAAYVGDTISRDVIGVRNAGWPFMIQIDNPRIYHKDEKYLAMGYKPDCLIRTLPEIIPALDAYNLNMRKGGQVHETC